jgi:asparagine synthase (glutamine-hydrolysing)
MPAAVLLTCRPDGLAPETGAGFERVAGELPARVRAMERAEHASPRMRIATWANETSVGRGPAIDRATGSSLTVLGNPTRRDLAAVAPDDVAQRLLADCLDSFERTVDSLSPPFALVFADGRSGAVHVAVDRCGLQHLYRRDEPDGTVWLCSSSLALAAGLGASLDIEGAGEWIAAGHFVSQRTFAREVAKLEPGARIELRQGRTHPHAEWAPSAELAPATDGDYRSAFLEALAASDEAGAATELTGGLDSRLVLSGRLASGLPTLAWTLGQSGSAELLTIDRLRRRADFDHIPVTLNGTLGARLPELAVEMHALADGEVNALEYAPLLVAFEALDGRRSASVSGSGGEIARAYYASALKQDGAIDVDSLVGKVSGATGAARAALRRDVFADPLAPLRTAVAEFVESSPASTPDRVLDDFYIRARMQRFGGRNISTTGAFCRQGLPFFDNRVVEASLGLPLERRRQGRVVRDAVAAWTPLLARVPLDTGIAVAPRGPTAPVATARWTVAMGRKALARYGGSAGRRLALTPPDPVPWDSVRATPVFREFVRDTLPAGGSRVHALLDPARTEAIVESALAGGSLYPLGLVMSLELTLARLGAG